MSDCPAYLAVTVTGLQLYDELFRYDLLVLCPATFSVNFRFPGSPPSPTPPAAGLTTSTFDVRLADAVRSQHVYLTHVHAPAPNYDADKRSEAAVFHRRVGASPSSSWHHSLLFYAVAAVVVTLAILSAFIHVDRLVRPARWVALTPAPTPTECSPTSPSREAACAYRPCGNGHVGHTMDQTPYCDVKYRCVCRSGDGRPLRVVSTRRYRLLVSAYATLWLVTGLLATFNVLFFVVGVLVDRDWRQLNVAMTPAGGDVRRAADANLSLLIDAHRRDELRRHRDGVVARVRACRHHVDDTLRRASASVAADAAPLADAGRSIAASTAEQYAGSLAAYGARVDAFAAALETRLTAAVGRTMRRYTAYINSLIDNAWLRFAVDVFNSTHQAAPPPSNHVDYYGLASPPVAGFGSFLDVDEVKQVELWVSRFWHR